MVSEYSTLVERLPVYYFNFTLPEADIEYLNNRRLAEEELYVEEIEKITQDFSLYKLKRR